MAKSINSLSFLDEIPGVEEEPTVSKGNSLDFLKTIKKDLPFPQAEIDAIKGIPKTLEGVGRAGKFAGNRLLHGGAQIMDTIGAMDEILPQPFTPEDEVGESIGLGTRERAQLAKKGLHDVLSPELQKLTKPLIKSTGPGILDLELDKDIAHNPMAVIAKITEQIPNMAATMFGGGALSKGLQTLPKIAGKKITQNVANAAGYGLSEGTLEGGFTATQVFDGVMATPEEKLNTAPFYQALIAQGDSPEVAQKKLAVELSRGAGLASGGANALLGAPMGIWFGKLFSKTLSGNPLTKLAKITAGEGLQETAQEGASAFVEGTALNKAGNDINVPKNVLQQALEGGLIGMGSGASVAGGTQVAQSFQEPQNTEAGNFRELIDDLIEKGEVREGPKQPVQEIDAPIKKDQQADIEIELESKAKEPVQKKAPRPIPKVKSPKVESPSVSGILKSISDQAKAQEPPSPKKPEPTIDEVIDAPVKEEEEFDLPANSEGGKLQRQIRPIKNRHREANKTDSEVSLMNDAGVFTGPHVIDFEAKPKGVSVASRLEIQVSKDADGRYHSGGGFNTSHGGFGSAPSISEGKFSGFDTKEEAVASIGNYIRGRVINATKSSNKKEASDAVKLLKALDEELTKHSGIDPDIKVKETKAKIIPTRAGVVAVPIEENIKNAEAEEKKALLKVRDLVVKGAQEGDPALADADFAVAQAGKKLKALKGGNETKAESPNSFAKILKEKMDEGTAPQNNRQVKSMVAEAHDKKPSQVTPEEMKDAQEDIEEANVIEAREVIKKGNPDKKTYDELVRSYKLQPILTARTSTSIENQAFSTPIPISFLAGRLARLRDANNIYEPTAGHGALLIDRGNNSKVSANELNKRRFDSLDRQGHKVTNIDATSGVIVGNKSQDSVITNPPFGGLGKNKTEIDGFKISKLDHLIVAQSLKAMKDDGRAVLIIGANAKHGKLPEADRVFFNYLYSNYNVADHFEIDGNLYNRQGSSFPIRIITIAGRQKSKTFAPTGAILRVKTFEELYEQFEKGFKQSEIIRSTGLPGGNDTGSGDTNPKGKPGNDPDSARGSDSGTTDSDVGGSGAIPTGDSDIRSNEPGRPALDQNEQTGDVGRDDDARTDNRSPERSGLEESGQPESNAGIETEKSAGISERADEPSGISKPGEERSRQPVKKKRTTSANALQVPYKDISVQGQSAGTSPKVLLPTNQVAPVQRTLERLVEKYGDLDSFVQKELGYKTKKDMQAALFGIQVDAIASAIDNAKRGVGMVIADQTGIGKGRQAAAMMRWAKRQGWIPVFITARPPLFTDMHRDLVGIGEKLNPVIVNGTPNATVIDRETKKAVWKGMKTSERREAFELFAQGKIPKGKDSVFLTYSQVSPKNSKQAQALLGIAKNAFLILDESHKAGGAGATDADGVSVGGSNTFRVIRDALLVAKGVTYLSATYAKRPDTIPIYFRTDLSKAFKGDVGKLVESANKGGTPYQNLISAALAESGQLVRRETSFDGIEVQTETPDIDTQPGRETIRRQEDSVNEAVAGLRGVIEFSKHFLGVEIKALNKKEQKSGDKSVGNVSQETNKIEGSNFAATAHNYIKQMLLGIKADEVAQRAVKAVKSGEKVVIVVENTMESFLSRFVNSRSLKDGSTLKGFDWGQILESALESTLTLKTKDAFGGESSRKMKESELTPGGRDLLNEVREEIQSIAVDAPASPIDWIINVLKREGVKVGEITGRTLTVNYSGKDPELGSRNKVDKDQNATLGDFNGFNDKSIDVVIINGSAAEGVSMHASETFPDKKPRRMIIAQPAGDINQYMQLMGRINRTGQVVLPRYTIMTAGVPAENRSSSILAGKLAKLNASTTANSKSALSFEVADILNEVGDNVVAEYLNQNAGMANALNVEIPVAAKDIDGFAKKKTGHVALLPIRDQQKFWNEVTEIFNDEIEYLNSIDKNPLETKFKELDATIKSTSEKVLTKGTSQKTAFESDALLAKYSVKKPGIPITVEKVADEIKRSLDRNKVKDAKEYLEKLKNIGETRANALNKAIADQGKDPEKIAELKAKVAAAKRDAFQNWKKFELGSAFTMNIEEDSFSGVVVDLNVAGQEDKQSNIFAQSRTKITFQVNKGFGKISIPLSKIASSGDLIGYRMPYPDLKKIFNPEVEGNLKENRYIVTGNLISGFTEVGNKGQIIDFSMSDGSRAQGIIMPRSFNPETDIRQEPLLKTPEEVLEFLKSNKDKKAGIRDEVGSGISDQLQIERMQTGQIRISVPSTKRAGGQVFLDKKLISITGDFAGMRGGKMSVALSEKKAKLALSHIMEEKAIALHGEAKDSDTLLSPFGNQRGSLSPAVLKDAYKNMGNMIFDHLSDKIKPHFGSLGALPDEQSYLVERYKILGTLAQIDEISGNLNRLFADLSKEDKQAIYEFMTTKGATVDAIENKKARIDAVRVKKMINAVGKKLVRKGLLAEDVFEKHSGEYLPRIYLKHLVAEKIGPGRGKVSDLGFLKKRKDIPEDVRRIILGEIQDPGLLSAKGFGKPMRDLAILELLDTIAQRPDWVLPSTVVEWDSREEISKIDKRFSYTAPVNKKGEPKRKKRVSAVWLTEEARRVREQAAKMVDDTDRQTAVKLADRMDQVSQPEIQPQDTQDFKQVPNTIRYGELRGMWVRKEIYDDLFGTANMITDDVSLAQQWIGDGGKLTKATQLWKLSKVALNPPTQIRNFVSNGVLLHLSGVSMVKIPIRVAEAIKQIRNNGPAWRIAKKYGVDSTTFSSQEMIAIDTEYLATNAKDGGAWASIKSLAGIVAKKASDVYGVSEAIFKTAKIIDAMGKGATQEEAALDAQKWLFDYSLVPSSVRFLRNSPIGIPFLTFYYKALPRMVEVAVKNPLRFAPYLIAPHLLSEFIASLYDVDEDDLEVLKRSLPFWLKNKGNAYFFPYKDQHGRWQAADVGYFFPWTMYTEMVNEMGRGEVSEFIGTTGLFGGPVLDMATAIKTNLDPFTKREIARPGDTPARQLASWMQYIWRLSAPTWLTDIGAANHLWKTLSGTVNPRDGRPLLTEMQAVFRFLGLNIYPVDPEASRLKNIQRMNYQIKETKRALKVHARNQNLTDEQRQGIVDEYQEFLLKQADELEKYEEESKVNPKLLQDLKN